MHLSKALSNQNTDVSTVYFKFVRNKFQVTVKLPKAYCKDSGL